MLKSRLAACSLLFTVPSGTPSAFEISDCGMSCQKYMCRMLRSFSARAFTVSRTKKASVIPKRLSASSASLHGSHFCFPRRKWLRHILRAIAIIQGLKLWVFLRLLKFLKAVKYTSCKISSASFGGTLNFINRSTAARCLRKSSSKLSAIFTSAKFLNAF